MNNTIYIKCNFTVMFEAPFWIGLYERFEDGYYEVCKITFGSEPKDYEVYKFLLNNWRYLKFSPPIKSEKVEERKIKNKKQKEAEKERKYALHQEKKKAKHRGK